MSDACGLGALCQLVSGCAFSQNHLPASSIVNAAMPTENLMKEIVLSISAFGRQQAVALGPIHRFVPMVGLVELAIFPVATLRAET